MTFPKMTPAQRKAASRKMVATKRRNKLARMAATDAAVAQAMKEAADKMAAKATETRRAVPPPSLWQIIKGWFA